MFILNQFIKSFNPYFNGYTTFTMGNINLKDAAIGGFNPYFNGYTTFTKKKKKSFNPCFNGYTTFTQSI